MDGPYSMDNSSSLDAFKRSEPRDSLFLLASIRALGTLSRDAAPLKIRNLSSGGLMGESECAFAQGDSVEVEMRGVGAVRGKIAWIGGGKLGISFCQKINPRLARKPIGATGGSAAGGGLPKVGGNLRRPGLRIL